MPGKAAARLGVSHRGSTTFVSTSIYFHSASWPRIGRPRKSPGWTFSFGSSAWDVEPQWIGPSWGFVKEAEPTPSTVAELARMERMKEAAATEVVGCTIDGGQEAKTKSWSRWTATTLHR